MTAKQLIIPVEIKNRELEGALVLASIFIRNGWIVYIGQKQQIFPYINQFSPSVMYVKSIVPGELSLLKKFKKNNHFIVTKDVEGLIFAMSEFGIKQRFSKKTIEVADLIFFWGKKQSDLWKKFYGKYRGKIHITGSQIIDSWKIFRKKIKQKKNQILIISSFPSENPYYKKAMDNMTKYTTKSGDISNFDKMTSKTLKTSFSMFENLKSLLILMEQKLNKKFKLVLRPHPSEGEHYWYKFTKNLKLNLKIEQNSKDIKDHILESEYIIHFASTSAVTSNLYKKKTLLYSTISNNDIKKYSPGEFSFKISNFYKNKEKMIIDLNRNKIKFINKKKTLESIANGISSKDNLYSSKKIFNLINKKYKYKSKKNLDPFNYKSYYYLIIYKLKHLIGFLIGKTFSFLRIKKNKFFHLTFRGANYKWGETSIKELNNYFKKIFNNKNINIIIEKHHSGFFKIKKS